MSAETASSTEPDRAQRRRETEEQIAEKRRARNAEHYGRDRDDPSSAPGTPPRGSGPARLVLALLTALLAVNLFTGGPLFAVWVGSQVQAGESQLGMSSIGAIVGVLVVVTLINVWLLSRIGHTYARLTGQPQKKRTVSYLQSRAADAVSKDSKERRQLNGFEKVLIAVITVAVLGFEVWFFLFSGSSIGAGGGR